MIQELIDKAIKESNKPHKRSGKYSPSMLGRCYRAQVWNRMDIPVTDPPEPRMYRIFKVGHLFHTFIQDLLVKSDPTIKTEVLIENEHFKGYADIVSKDEVSDIKSIHSRGFFYLKTDTIADEKKTNVLQVLWYAKHLKKKKGRLIFVSKDDLCIGEYIFDLNEKWKSLLYNEEKILVNFWKSKAMPPAKPRAFVNKQGMSMECEKYCPWRTVCKKIELEGGEVK